MPIIPCPWLPEIHDTHDFTLTRRHGAEKGTAFYLDALRYAQSQWLSGKPAQAILQLNKAWMADLIGNEDILKQHPSPFRALAWIMTQGFSENHGFMGNPVRHFQHLASRMSGPRSEARSWRAWVCFHLAEHALPDFPRDEEQIMAESLIIPRPDEALQKLQQLGWAGEHEIATQLLRPLRS